MNNRLLRQLQKAVFMFIVGWYMFLELFLFSPPALAYDSVTAYCNANPTTCINVGGLNLAGSVGGGGAIVPYTATVTGTGSGGSALSIGSKVLGAGAGLLFGIFTAGPTTTGEAEMAGLTEEDMNALREQALNEVGIYWYKITRNSGIAPIKETYIGNNFGKLWTSGTPWNFTWANPNWRNYGGSWYPNGTDWGPYLRKDGQGIYGTYPAENSNIAGGTAQDEPIIGSIKATLSDWNNIPQSIRQQMLNEFSESNPDAIVGKLVGSTTKYPIPPGTTETTVNYSGNKTDFGKTGTNPTPSPTPSSTPGVTPTPGGEPSPAPSPGTSPAPTPEPTPGGEPSPAPTPEPTPGGEPSPAPSPGASPTPGSEPTADFNPVQWGNPEFFVTNAISKFGPKFPFDIFGTVSAGSISNECPSYTFFEETIELCLLRDAILALKIPVQIALVIIFYQRL